MWKSGWEKYGKNFQEKWGGGQVKTKRGEMDRKSAHHFVGREGGSQVGTFFEMFTPISIHKKPSGWTRTGQ